MYRGSTPSAPRGVGRGRARGRGRGSTSLNFGLDDGHIYTPTEVMELLRRRAIPGADVASSTRQPPPRCHPGTRIRLLEEVAYWRSRTPQLWRDIFWITGPAGCGKSAIAQTLAELCQKGGQLGAALFLSRTNQHSEISRIIPTIAYQLAKRDPLYRGFITSVFSKDPMILKKPMPVQFRKLLQDPSRTQQFEGQSITLDPFIIILDGLDECGDDVAQLQLVDLIDDHIRSQPYDPPFIWVVFSRPESHVKQFLARFDEGEENSYCAHTKLSISDPQSMQDVVRFLRDGFSDIRERYSDKFHLDGWPTKAQFMQVMHASSGYFPFASCILQFVGDKVQQNPVAQLAMCLDFFNNNNHPHLSTTHLFRSLDEIYRQILSSVQKEDLPTVLNILRFCISNSGGSYTLNTIRFALRIRLAQIYDALRDLHSLLDVPAPEQAGTEGLRFYHSSFPEFLRDPRRSGEYTIKRGPQGVSMLEVVENPAALFNVKTRGMDVPDGVRSSSSRGFETSACHDPSGVDPQHPPLNESVAELGFTLSSSLQLETTKKDLEITKLPLSRVLKTSQSRNALLKLKGDRAQLMVDYLHSLLLAPSLPLPWLRKHTLIALRELSRASLLYPHCYHLKDIVLGSHETGSTFSDIYKGGHGDHLLCLKVVRLFQKSETEAMLKIYAKEAILWGQLHHPNIAPFYGIYYLNEERKRVCLVSPWMNNGNLVDYLKTNPSASRSLFISDVVAGLEYLHSQSLIHGDIKGPNVLVNDSERACITDFGLSIIRTDKTLAYTIAGTTAHGCSYPWAAPELLDDSTRATLASDVWALGCVVHEILTGLPPFDGTNEFQIFKKLGNGELPAKIPVSSPGSAENAIWELVARCWTKEPSNRPSCQDISQELKRKGLAREQEETTGDTAQERRNFQAAMRKNEEVPLDLGGIEQILNELCTTAAEPLPAGDAQLEGGVSPVSD